jgi:hypothetical protein
MADFIEEFGFLPPELLYKCDQYIRGFHREHGSGAPFVAASLLQSEKSPFLMSLVRNIGVFAQLLKVLNALAVAVIVIAIVTGWWLLTALLAVLVPAAAWVYKSSGDMLLEQRAIILSLEMLAIDFAGWASLFPEAAKRGSAFLAHGSGGMLVDLYLTDKMRTDPGCIELWAPSEGSIKSARQ